MKQEIMEAIEAGERALFSLRQAHKELKSARGWGLADLFGGGLIMDFIKHSKMKEASRWMEEAQKDLRIFEQELRDVDVSSGLEIETDDFLSFADFFFDGVIADYMMHARISETKEKVEEAIDRVTYLLATLQERYARMEK